MSDQLSQIQDQVETHRDRQRKKIASEYARLLRVIIDGETLSESDRASMASVMAVYQLDSDTVHADADWCRRRMAAVDEIATCRRDIEAMTDPLKVGERLNEIDCELRRLTEEFLSERDALESESARRLSLEDRIRERRLFLTMPRSGGSGSNEVERTRARSRDILGTGVFAER
jgi:hypothetical protein